MFELKLKTELLSITADNSIIDTLWSEIKINYSEPGRYYHTLVHLDNLTAELFTIKEKITDWQTLMFSIAYHDIIYNPLRNDNEEKSADLAFSRLTFLNLPEVQKQKCKEQVIATKGHNHSADSDTNYFTDADLAILGSEPGLYKEYSKAIRKEYQGYPDVVYRQARKKVLDYFMQMPKIYKTTFFASLYEAQARKNISNEFKELSNNN